MKGRILKYKSGDLIGLGLKWVIIVSLHFFEHLAHAADQTDISRLRQTILQNYDKNSRPVQNGKSVTQVEVAFTLEGFEVDENRNLFTLHSVSILRWYDEHLKWDPKDYRNLSELQFAANELWKPDLAVYNNVDRSEIDHFGNTLLMVGPKGHVDWFPPTKFQVGCPLDLKLWPFDTQICQIVVGSWTHAGEEISFYVTDPKLIIWDYELENVTSGNPTNWHFREWKLTSDAVQLNTRNYSCCPGPYYDVTITMTIQRQGSSHTAVVVAVAYGIAGAILVSFWLSPHANERMPLILVTFMLNALFLYIVYKAISSNGLGVPLVVGYYRDSLLMVTFAIVWTVLLRYIAGSKREATVPLPSLVSSFLDSWGATLLCLNPRPKTAPRDSSLSEEDEKELVKEKNTYQEDWAWLAHLLDRFMFIIYVIIYICFFIAFF